MFRSSSAFFMRLVDGGEKREKSEEKGDENFMEILKDERRLPRTSKASVAI